MQHTSKNGPKLLRGQLEKNVEHTHAMQTTFDLPSITTVLEGLSTGNMLGLPYAYVHVLP